MAQYEEQNQLDYRPGGDTIDDFAQKYMKEINRVYQFLNNIREHNSNGTYQVEPQPYIFKVTDNKLYIRNGANNAWLYLFDITYRMGMSDNPDAVILTSDDVTSTAEALKLVKTNTDGDIDANITGNASKFGNKTAEQYITVDDVSDSGAALKIVKTDSNGVAQISISGSAVQLNGKEANYYLNQDDVTTSGEANKIVKTDANGKIAADITGNAAKFGNKTADHYLTTDDVATVEAGTITSTPNKLVKTNSNGLLPVNISGNAGQIAGKNAEINNLQDGQVLTFRLASNTWRNEDKGVVGAGKALSVYDGQTLKFEYSGDAPKSLDIGTTAMNGKIDTLTGLAARETGVSEGATAMLSGLPAGWYVECTTAGTTGSTTPVISSPTVGGTVTDGTVVWTIRKSASTQDLTQYLPLSGGTMTGSKIYADNSSHFLQLYGGPASDDSGYLYIAGSQYRGGNDSAGRFVLKACAGSIDKYEMCLEGYRKGELKYATKDSGGNVIGPYDLGGSAIIAKSLGQNGYIKRADGLTWQWGLTNDFSPNESYQDVSFPTTFANAVFSVVATQQDIINGQLCCADVHTSYFKLYREKSQYSTKTGCFWQAVGY